MDLYNVEGPLYVLKWNPKKYFSGLHTIELQVKDAHGRENSYSQPFVLDDTRLSFSLLSRIALMTDASTIVRTFRQTGQNNWFDSFQFRVMFVSTLIMCILPLIVLRILHKLVEGKQSPRIVTLTILPTLRKKVASPSTARQLLQTVAAQVLGDVHSWSTLLACNLVPLVLIIRALVDRLPGGGPSRRDFRLGDFRERVLLAGFFHLRLRFHPGN